MTLSEDISICYFGRISEIQIRQYQVFQMKLSFRYHHIFLITKNIVLSKLQLHAKSNITNYFLL